MNPGSPFCTYVYTRENKNNFSLGNGETIEVSRLNIPSSGVWLVFTKGWSWTYNGGYRIDNGYVTLVSADGVLSYCDLIGKDQNAPAYTFSACGIFITSEPSYVSVELTQYTGATRTFSSSSNFSLSAVKIGNVRPSLE